MNMKRVRIFSLLLLVVGTFLLLGGAGGFVSLYMASQKYEHTTGVIRDYPQIRNRPHKMTQRSKR